VAEIEATRTATGRPFAVNVLTFDFAPVARPIIDAVIDAAPPVVTLSFGEPTRYVERCRDAGCLTLVQVQDIAGLRAALDAGADAVIVQGNEAGGHTGRRGTLSFLAQALELAGEIPIVAAGGIANGRGLAGALAMGAAGCVMGTRFKATIEFEALAASEKDQIVASDGDDSVYDQSSDVASGVEFPDGIAPRVLRSQFTEAWTGRDDELRAKVNEMAPLAFVMELAGNGNAINFAGESAGLIDAILPAAEVVRRTVAEAEHHLSNVAAIVGAP
jgi:nitronate monooxygenase